MNNANPSGKPVNLLDLVPEPCASWTKNKDGLVILFKPKFKHPFFQKHILPHMRRPHYKIKLDTVGSFILEHCDGTRTVREVGEKLKAQFGDQVEPLFDRLSLFFQQLERNRFILFKGEALSGEYQKESHS